MNYKLFNEIKNKISVIDYAKRNGLPVNEEGDRTDSFINPANNPNCVVYYKNYWNDFKENKRGDVIDLCAILKHNGNTKEAIIDLKNQLGIDKEEFQEIHSGFLDKFRKESTKEEIDKVGSILNDPALEGLTAKELFEYFKWASKKFEDFQYILCFVEGCLMHDQKSRRENK